MSTLRVLLDAAPAADRADAWALFDAHDRVVRTGRGAPAAWPAARAQGSRAGGSVRAHRRPCICRRCPPIASSAAAAFALEDQLAGPADEQHIAVSPQRADGTVEAIVANRGLVAASRRQTSIASLAEPALAPLPPARHWRWYASGTRRRLRAQAGRHTRSRPATPTGLPAELTLALDHAATPQASGPVSVEMAFAVGRGDARPTSRSIPARRSCPTAAWRWDAAEAPRSPRRPTCARASSRAPRLSSRDRSARLFRLAAIVAAAAVGLHVAATIGEWAVAAHRRLAREVGAGRRGTRRGRRCQRRPRRGNRQTPCRRAPSRGTCRAGRRAAAARRAPRRRSPRCPPARSSPQLTPTATGRSTSRRLDDGAAARLDLQLASAGLDRRCRRPTPRGRASACRSAPGVQ